MADKKIQSAEEELMDIYGIAQGEMAMLSATSNALKELLDTARSTHASSVTMGTVIGQERGLLCSHLHSFLLMAFIGTEEQCSSLLEFLKVQVDLFMREDQKAKDGKVN